MALPNTLAFSARNRTTAQKRKRAQSEAARERDQRDQRGRGERETRERGGGESTGYQAYNYDIRIQRVRERLERSVSFQRFAKLLRLQKKG